MSSTMNDRDDPARIEQHGEAIRANMNATLDALGRKLSPGQLIDRSAAFLRDHGGEVAVNLSRQVRENPLPLALTAIGLVWLIAASSRTSSSRTSSTAYGTDDYAPDDYATAYTTGDAEQESSTFAHAKERVQRTAAHLKERVQQTAGAAREKLQGASDRLRSATEGAPSGGDGSAGRVSSAVRSTRAQVTRAKDGFATLAEEQPLALGAIGLALGAIVGAVLPGTRREDELLGRTRDRTLDRARELGTEQYSQLRERAIQAADRAQQAAKEAFTGEPGSEDQRAIPGEPRDEGSFRGASTPVGRA